MSSFKRRALLQAFGASAAAVPAASQPVMMSSEQVTADGGTYLRFLSSKLGDALTAEDFGVQKGVARDQSAALNSMFGAAEDVVGQAANNGLQLGKFTIDLGSGSIHLEQPVNPIPFGITIAGRGPAHTRFECHGDFYAFDVQEFESDGTTRRYHNGMWFRDFTVISRDPSNRTSAFRLRNLIRNSGLERVLHQGCKTGFDIDWSWTFQLANCGGQGGTGEGAAVMSLTDNHIYLGKNNGAIHVIGGRFDVFEENGIHAVGSDTLELFVRGDATFQFGKKGGIKVRSARTVDIDGAFLEGNCIGNPSEYYLDLNGSASPLAQCRVRATAINNRGDRNRDGLGIARIDGFETVQFEERWSRNGVKDLPIIGPNVTRAKVFLQTSAQMTSAELLHLAGPKAAEASAEINSPARPMQFYGRVINGKNLSQAGTASFGRQGEASVMLGAAGGEAIIQGHDGNAKRTLSLQGGAGGLVCLSGIQKRLTHTSSSYTPSDAISTAVLDTKSGGLLVRMDLAKFVFPVGYELEVLKPSELNDVVFVPPDPTDEINGIQGMKSVSEPGRYVMTKISTIAWMLTHQYLA
ncbi:hypothetical protein [Neorhizobium sp. S3-V5DH]|uniref:hypothetical protein n=1 Tax=Neorhizobium sp. S3-V5DH TaxID=2485166 RepID=UPI001050E730|nr:hypothetical protein [Neorhizobium sp. S3-V5DH]TCV66268.1 hypothetical protein EDE09_11618 [Neorhizobium sp. S3-V5DH]